ETEPRRETARGRPCRGRGSHARARRRASRGRAAQAERNAPPSPAARGGARRAPRPRRQWAFPRRDRQRTDSRFASDQTRPPSHPPWKFVSVDEVYLCTRRRRRKPADASRSLTRSHAAERPIRSQVIVDRENRCDRLAGIAAGDRKDRACEQAYTAAPVVLDLWRQRARVTRARVGLILDRVGSVRKCCKIAPVDAGDLSMLVRYFERE